MNRQGLINANVWAARNSWNCDGLNRGADPEVLADLGVILPEELPGVIGRVLEAHGALESEPAPASRASAPACKPERSKGGRWAAWNGRPPSKRELMLADKRTDLIPSLPNLSEELARERQAETAGF